MTMSNNFVQEIPSKKAIEFIEKLSPHSKYFRTSRIHEWGKGPIGPFFRGIGDDKKYKLIPSIFRDQNLEILKLYCPVSIDEDKNLDLCINHILAEINFLIQFMYKIDQNGLSLPGDSVQWRQILQERYEDFQKILAINTAANPIIPEWPIDAFIPLMALAQHYGLPTRLLDWSTNPLKAAFFAVNETYNKELLLRH